VEQCSAEVRDPRDPPPAAHPQRRPLAVEIEDGHALREPHTLDDGVSSRIDPVDESDTRPVRVPFRIDVGTADPDRVRRRRDAGPVGARSADHG